MYYIRLVKTDPAQPDPETLRSALAHDLDDARDAAAGLLEGYPDFKRVRISDDSGEVELFPACLLSEVIAALQAVLEEHGDLPAVSGEMGGYFEPVYIENIFRVSENETIGVAKERVQDVLPMGKFVWF